MAKSVARLSVHKNTVERRRKRDVAKEVRDGAERMVREHDIRAYAVVGLDAKGEAHAFWDTGSIMPMWAFPSVVGTILDKDMGQRDAEEDWVPPLKT